MPLQLLPSLPGKQFFTRLAVSSQEELDAFRKTPDHPPIITSAYFLVGDPLMPKGGTRRDHVIIPDDMPLTFRRESGNQTVFGHQKTKRHKVRWYGVSLCLDEKQNEELMARHVQARKAARNAQLAADPLSGCITIAQLIRLLETKVPSAEHHKTLVVLSTDSEGNCYSPIGSYDVTGTQLESPVAAPEQTFKCDDGRTVVTSVEFVDRTPDDIIDGMKPPATPKLSRRNAIILYPST